MPHPPRSRDRLDDDHMTAEVLWREREGERMREREREELKTRLEWKDFKNNCVYLGGHVSKNRQVEVEL